MLIPDIEKERAQISRQHSEEREIIKPTQRETIQPSAPQNYDTRSSAFVSGQSQDQVENTTTENLSSGSETLLLSPESFMGHTAEQLSHTSPASGLAPPGHAAPVPASIPPGPTISAPASVPPGFGAQYSSPHGIPLTKPVVEQSWADYQQQMMMAPASFAPPPGFQAQYPPQTRITPERVPHPSLTQDRASQPRITPERASSVPNVEQSNTHSAAMQSYGRQCKTPENNPRTSNSVIENQNTYDRTSVYAAVCSSLYGAKSHLSREIPAKNDFFPDFARLEQKQEPVAKYSEPQRSQSHTDLSYSQSHGSGDGNMGQARNRSDIDSTSESEAQSEAQSESSAYVDDYDSEFPTLAKQKKGRQELIRKAMERDSNAKEVKIRPFGMDVGKCVICQSKDHKTFECPKKNRSNFFQ